jgi:hypothetical protein
LGCALGVSLVALAAPAALLDQFQRGINLAPCAVRKRRKSASKAAA